MRDKMTIKKHILILTIHLLTLMVTQGQTNIYHPFPNSAAIWTETFSQNPCYCPPIGWCTGNCGDYHKYSMNGDTLFGSHYYQKIYDTPAHYQYGTQYSGVFPYTKTFSMGIRQDTLTKKIYMFNTNFADTLLYNFDLNVGDTLPSSFVNDNSTLTRNYVSSIDSILIGTTYRKQYHVSSINPTDSNYVQLIEGIGSNFGLTARLAPPFETGNILNCFSQNNVTMYVNPNNWMGDCNFTLSIKETKNISPLSFSVYPNPFSSSTILTSNQTDFTVTIYNLCGERVKQIQTFTKQTILTRDNLPSGLYFICLTKGNIIIASDKLIIVDN